MADAFYIKSADEVRQEQKTRISAEEKMWLEKIAGMIDHEIKGSDTSIWVSPPRHLFDKIKKRLNGLGYTVTIMSDQRDGDSLRIDW